MYNFGISITQDKAKLVSSTLILSNVTRTERFIMLTQSSTEEVLGKS